MGTIGNDNVIAGFDALMAHARGGAAGYLIALMVDQNGKGIGGWFGSSHLEEAALQEIERMLTGLRAKILNKTLPERDPSVRADRVCFNVPASPTTYDFIAWLVDAEITRRVKGAPAPLKVAFWFGRDGNFGFETANRQKMFENVVRPALELIGAVEDPTAIDGHYKPFFALRDVVHAVNLGFSAPELRAPPKLARAMCERHQARPPVTITLREADSFPYRNSNMQAWFDFARYLRTNGEKVIFVRDTAKADEPVGYFFDICPEASRDLHYRMALYEAAKINLFVSNGPASLCQFSDMPWMMFTRIEPDGHEYTPNTPSSWRDNFGIEVGQQFPWSRPDQRIIWKPDDYENLIAAWEEFQPTAKIAAGE